MKICVVGFGNEDGIRSWTDVAITLCNKFKYYSHDAIYYRWQGKIGNKVVNKVKCILNRYIYSALTIRDPGTYFFNALKFRRLLSRVDCECFLFMGEQCLVSPVREGTRAYAYIDEALQPIIRTKYKNKRGMDLFFKYYEKNDANSLRKCNYIFTQNEWTRKYLISNYKIDECKIQNIGFGINVNYYEGKKDYSNHRIMIVLRKGLEEVKGLDLLIDAFLIAKKDIKDLQLDVVGTDYIKHEGINYYFNKSRDMTMELFRRDSLYVMPARYEANGITYLEALANKMPIVGMNQFAFPEFCGYGQFGFILDDNTPSSIASTIKTAFINEDRLMQMGILGQEFVRQKYNWNMVAEKMLSVMT